MSTPASPNTPELLTVEDASHLNLSTVSRYFRQHISPGQYEVMQLLGFDEILIDNAEGMYYLDRSGRRILDFFGGFGSVALGHNHPRILAARKRFEEDKRHDIALAFMSQYAAVLARNLAMTAPGDLDMVHLCSSGSEAVEAAIKLAEKVQGPDRNTIVHARHSFHGKTKGALAVTDSEVYQSTFCLPRNKVCIPFGDAQALESILMSDPSIGIVILESIQGGAGVIVPPDGYLAKVRRLCDQHRVLLILDEVQCGFGRTGRFFAFEHEQVIPDMVVMAKSLGGAKAAIGALIARRPCFMAAYGTSNSFLAGSMSTFGGMGETCITAIESLNILYDERLMENCTIAGQHLLSGLEALRSKYPSLIKDIRGRGLMAAIEFQDVSQYFPSSMRQLVARQDHRFKGGLCGIIGSALLKEFNILVAFTEYNRNVTRLEPPLIVTTGQIDTFLRSLDQLLQRGIFRLAMSFAFTTAQKKILGLTSLH